MDSKAPLSELQRLRSYSRFDGGKYETWDETCNRTLYSPHLGLQVLGKFTKEEIELIDKYQRERKAFGSARWLWVGGTEWVEKPENYNSAFNCTTTRLIDWDAFGYLMDLSMQGCGTGCSVETECIEQLQPIVNKLNLTVVGEPGKILFGRQQKTAVYWVTDVNAEIVVGDSRKGWVDAYKRLLELSSDEDVEREIHVNVNIANVRPSGERLKGFGGTANPIRLKTMFERVAAVLNGAVGRKLNSLECCQLVGEAASAVVAGNIRRSAGMKQGSSDDEVFLTSKDNLWQQDESGNWRIDPERDSLRMSNHTVVYHTKPTLDECLKSVEKQFYSGEGAIQYAPEAIARANVDLLNTPEKKKEFLLRYDDTDEGKESAYYYLVGLANGEISNQELNHRMNRYELNPCFAAGTMVLTSVGDYPIESLVGKTVEVYDGSQWVEIDNFRITGKNQHIYKVSVGFNDCSDYDDVFATKYHTFILKDGSRVKLEDLKPGDKLATSSKERETAEVIDVTFYEVADKVYCCTVPTNHSFTLSNGLLVGQCGEIIGSNLHCNLASVHLNQLDPFNLTEQQEAFKASALQAVALLQRGFTVERYQKSREFDPIVGVSFTGAFTFFTKAFGSDWLKWWKAGRDENWDDVSENGSDRIADIANSFDDWYGYRWGTKVGLIYKDLESRFLKRWKETVNKTVWEYCDHHNLKRPNRCTTLKPEGSQTLLTGVGCNGLHAPKGWYYIRRMTFAKNDPIALAAIDYGYTVIPSQSDKDENGHLLNDPFDSRCTEWLVEVPVEEEIVKLFPEAACINPGKFSALAQFDWLMQVQNYYVTHNTSTTLEFTQGEIEPLANRIYQAIQTDEGYISAALLARFEANETYPRLPFEPITKKKYQQLVSEVLQRRKSDDFDYLVSQYVGGMETTSPQDSACGDGFCAIGGGK